jgi:hypothetical protein
MPAGRTVRATRSRSLSPANARRGRTPRRPGRGRVTTPATVIGLGLLVGGQARANEGQWTPDQISKLDAKQLEEMGLELSPNELWNAAGDERTGGLLRAAVNLSGCSAAFISPRGLIATNHHCAYGALQANSTVEHDYLADGFLAMTQDQELEAKGRTVRVLRAVSDVTARVNAVADAAADDPARARAIDRVEKTIVKDCEAAAAVRCQVASFYNGSVVRLFEYVELTDVRVVYAPPAAVGEYGGEVDNWMWPRHTGDFALLRAYTGSDGTPRDHDATNVPYQPAQWLRVSDEGVAPGDFVGVLGYPGRTQRYLSAAEVGRSIEQTLPTTVDLYGEWIDIYERNGARDEAVKIKVAADKKGLANRHKNARGMLNGLEHMKLLERRTGEEAELRTWAADKPQFQGVLDELSALSARARTHHERDVLLSMVRRGPKSLANAVDLLRIARSRTLDDLDRPWAYMDRNLARTKKRIQSRVRDFDATVDAELLASWLARATRLPESQALNALTSLPSLTRDTTPGESKSFLPRSNEMVAATKFAQAAAVDTLLEAPELAATQHGDDPVLRLASVLVDEIESMEERRLAHSGALARLRPKYFEMLGQVRTGPIYPDANGTLRFSYASVRAYDKWDGSAQSPQTTLAGAVAKHTGADPFALPAKVRQHAADAPNTYWADPELKDVPLCFLSDADTTGGNSGSPVIDGKGRLVGFNFDRVWENIAGDFAYHEAHSRNISADVRHLLWMLDKVDDAGAILEEIGMARFREKGRRASAPAPAEATSDEEKSPVAASEAPSPSAPAANSGCSCGTSGSAGDAPWTALLLPPLVLARRRRQR